MKNNILILFIIALLASCKKEEVATLAESVEGNYTINSIKANDKAVSGVTGNISIAAETADRIDSRLTLTLQGKTEFDDFEDLTLKADGSDIDIYQGADLVGTFSGNNIIFYLADGADLFEFKATK